MRFASQCEDIGKTIYACLRRSAFQRLKAGEHQKNGPCHIFTDIYYSSDSVASRYWKQQRIAGTTPRVNTNPGPVGPATGLVETQTALLWYII
jgi:hypothetical protein